MEEVGDGVVTFDGGAAGTIHPHRQMLSYGRSGVPFNKVEPRVAGLLRGGDAPQATAGVEFTGIAELTAHFGIADRIIEHDRGAILEVNHFLNVGAHVFVIVSNEVGGDLGLDLRELNDGFLLGGARLGLLGLHQLVEDGDINAHPTFTSEQFGEV